jgi:hypothetical protein
MKARELPGTKNEQSELLHEITEIAVAEDPNPDPHAHIVASRLSAMKRHAGDVLSLVGRAKSSLFDALQRVLGGRNAPGRAGR